MTNANPTFQLYADFYPEVLLNVRGIIFTPRHMDIIACLINGEKDNRIGQLLSIREGTVETHKSNIRHEIQKKSHEDIIRFTQKAKNVDLIRDHYQRLLYKFDVERELKNLAVLSKRKNLICCIKPDAANKERLKTNSSFIRLLCQHLTLVGITIVGDETVSDTNTWTLHLDEDVTDGPQNHINLLYKTTKSFSSERMNAIDFRDPQHYFSSLLRLLQTFFSDSDLVNLNALISEGNDPNRNFYNNDLGAIALNNSSLPLKFNEVWKRQIILWGIFVCLVMMAITSFVLQNKIPSQAQAVISSHTVRSDLVIPTESVLLHRPELMAQINKKLDNQQGIKSIALVGVVGMGGVGKTTLARLYGRSQQDLNVWELNAETLETLMNSFMDLAYALAETKEKKEELSFIQHIQNNEEKEKQIIAFVKHHLKEKGNWLLIYDNVEDFSKLQHYFPNDPNVWGKGRVIITTRDSNIENTSYLTTGSVINIEELSSSETLTLFSKILFGTEVKNLTKSQKDNALSVLKYIPPFPLDVSLAAYYMKNTGIDYGHYVKELGEYHDDFQKNQEFLLKETTHYTKTRYGIIALTLQKLIHQNANFKELLLLISLLDSQNIPLEILNYCKDNITVDKFIYNLKKYSLLLSPKDKKLSLHRSVQANILDYIIRTTDIKQRDKLIENASQVIVNYTDKITEEENFPKMELFVPHCEKLLSHTTLLSPKVESIITGQLGSMYYHVGRYTDAKDILNKSLSLLQSHKMSSERAWVLIHLGIIYRELGDFHKAKDFLEQGLAIFNQQKVKSSLKIAKALRYLGAIYRSLDNYDKAIDFLKQSLFLYKQHLPETETSIAWNLSLLGVLYFEVGDYKTAEGYLEQSLLIYRKNYPESGVDIAWALILLGNVYKKLGHNTKVKELENYTKAKDLLEQSLSTFRKALPNNHFKIAWLLEILGNAYNKLENYTLTEEYLKKSLEFYKKYFSDDHWRVAKVLSNLGDVYRASKQIKKAKDYYEQSLSIYNKNYKFVGIKQARVFKNLGKVYLMNNEFVLAEDILKKALVVFEKNNHPDIYEVYESLADLNLKKAEMLQKDKKNSEYKVLAVSYLKKALEILTTHFPKDSTHRIRIEKKLQTLSAS